MKVELERYKSYIVSIPGCFWKPDIPVKKLHNAHVVHSLDEDEDIIILKDVTVFGTAKNSWVLTRKKVHFNHIKNNFNIEYSKIDSVSSVGGHVIINDFPKAMLGNRSDANKFVNFLQRVLNSKV
jgi:hypothetical protein